MKYLKNGIKSACMFNFWFGPAYGGLMTAYALKEVLETFNCQPLLADNRIDIVKYLANKYTFTKNFYNEHFNISAAFSQFSNIIKENLENEIFITGSDQVFRPKYTSDLSMYLLDFANPSSKKIAFSASFGVEKEQFLIENSPEIIEHMKNSLKSFDFISVREKSGVLICKDLFDIDAEWIIDPVFILEKENYNRLIKNSTINYKNKIVTYVLDTNKSYTKVYKFLSKKYNEKVIETANSDISVENWLASIRDCDLFVTDSFHGMCFAIIFNKPFICIANKSRGRTRFESVCEMLGIENQCVDSINEVTQKDSVFKIDYKLVNERIIKERQRGLDFIKKALEDQVKVTQEKVDVRTKYLEHRIEELEEQNNLSYQLKNFLWEKCLIIHHCYLPDFIKSIIIFFWHFIKGDKNACRK